QVRRRAYEFYEECGCEDGHDVEHWLRAEVEIMGTSVKAATSLFQRIDEQKSRQPRGFCHTARRDWLSEQNMKSHSYPTSTQLDSLVFEMYNAGTVFSEAVREFRKEFCLTALRDTNWNETNAARKLGMHRNTLARTLRDLNIDSRALRRAERHPV